MILSVSRRTDIPACYAEWFFNRVQEKFALVRNPRNFHQVSRVRLEPAVVDGIVFWTKNPIPMLNRLEELSEYTYYFQFTLTPYGRELEPGLPDKPSVLIPAFQQLSRQIGADRVIWRYDPVLLSRRYTMGYHLRAFRKIAEELHPYTRRVTISWIDLEYRGVQSHLRELDLVDFPPDARMELAFQLAETARSFGLQIDACAESSELRQCGIKPARCIDTELLEKLLGCRLEFKKDTHQRPGCGCAESVDLGLYNTCQNGCRYCYANYSSRLTEQNVTAHDPLSPLLSGILSKKDRVRERTVSS